MVIRTVAVGVAAAAALSIAVPTAVAQDGPPSPVSTNGNKVTLFANGLKTPTSFAFGAGQVFVGDGGDSEGNGPPNGGVYVIQDGQGVKIPSKLKFVGGLAWHGQKLFVSGAEIGQTGINFVLDRWGGWNGTTFTQRKTIFTAPKGFDGFNGLGFGANGRLYVGVDVGLTDNNDHGRRTKSPFVYDILTFNPDGTGRKVFARGMRQPWQMAFSGGSNAPWVTDLGQDSGAQNPPDFILHVKAGQDYGFPKCNQTDASTCSGYATPFGQYAPHTDLMGIAKQKTVLYLTSFGGTSGEGPGGEVVMAHLHRSGLEPLITGFVAPTVGLGLHGGYVYVGELTGQVYRLRVDTTD